MRSAVSILLVALAVASCDNDRTQQRRQERDAGTGCGNGELEEGEACDGTNFGAKTCVTEGFESGTLNCSATCELLTTSCVRRCGNGVVDSDEQCDGDAGRPTCPDYGYGSCTPACQRDISHCRSDPFDFGAGHALLQAGGAYLGDVPPAGLSDLIIATPDFGRVEAFAYTTTGGFATSSRKLSTNKAPLWPIVAQLDGTGGQDIAIIDADTSVDRFLSQANGFSLQPISAPLDGGLCPPKPFIGAARLDPDALDDLVFYGCRRIPDAGFVDDFVVIRGGPSPTREIIFAGEIITSTLADLDGDGLLDILYVSTAAPSELRGFRSAGAAFQALPARSLSFAPNQLAAGDFDEDGDQDLAASDGATVRIFENTGTAMVEKQSRNSTPVFLRTQDLDLDGRADVWFTKAGGVEILRSAGNFTFTPFTEPIDVDAGIPLGVNAADVEGDGDPDIAASYRTGTDTTTTRLLLNRVR